MEIKETGYTITRGGVTARFLSEGETTAIALLYFLKTLQDRHFEMENGVIVLDDPASSLDVNALFLAFGYIQNCKKEAGQLFVLTHNFTFFRQVHDWFQHLNRQNKKERPARFLMLDTVQEADIRNSCVRQLDPLLEEYQYLFARIYRASTETASQTLELNYVLPNMARRLLEAFLAFRLPRSGSLWRKLEEVQFDKAKKRRILRFLNVHSHSIAVGEPEHDLMALTGAPAVLENQLQMIQSLDNDHYSEMVSVVENT